MRRQRITGFLRLGAVLAAVMPLGCEQFVRQRVAPLEGGSSGHPEPVLWELADPLAENVVVDSAEQNPEDYLKEPYHLGADNIIRILFNKSPLMIASRERMVAAQYGLEEFKANLSRLEPYVRADASISDFPERRDARLWESETRDGCHASPPDHGPPGGLLRARIPHRCLRRQVASVTAGQVARSLASRCHLVPLEQPCTAKRYGVPL